MCDSNVSNLWISFEQFSKTISKSSIMQFILKKKKNPKCNFRCLKEKLSDIEELYILCCTLIVCFSFRNLSFFFLIW